MLDCRRAGGRPSGISLRKLQGTADILGEFKEFCRVDLQLKEGTIKSLAMYVRKFLNFLNGDLTDVKVEDIRRFLSTFSKHEPSTYRNVLKAIRRLVRDLKPPYRKVYYIIPMRKSKTAPKREGAVGGRDGNDGFAGCAVAP